jgi:peptidoglycan/LPS O-acetylase OafA/YrhL
MALASSILTQLRGVPVTFAGLDSIRFLCALWVVFQHLRVPSLGLFIDASAPAAAWAVTIVDRSFSLGQSPVIIFFVISGFCIHYPHSKDNAIPSNSAYLMRRYIRIGVPLVPALLFSKYVLHVNLGLFEQTIYWSLLAELIYYTLYPALLRLRNVGVSWIAMIAAAYLGALAVAASNPFGGYSNFSPHLTWVIGLPSWLAGCALAEYMRANPNGSDPSIWTWRVGVFALAVFLASIRAALHISYIWTLNLFAVVASLWLIRELYRYQHRRPFAVLEWAGSWSYSLYLFHFLAIHTIPRLPQISAHARITWLLDLAFILASSLAFAFLFEFPSHKLARTTSSWMRGMPRVVAGASV